MKRTTLLALAAVSISVLTAFSFPTTVLAPASASAPPSVTPFHCQVPCGIYGDRMRIDMLMEDAATIAKAMDQLTAMDAEESPSKNQMVRWVVNKEQHAQNIQDQVAAYWLAQRIKAPADAADTAAREAYHHQLEVLHGITVAAMKCKQTTDLANVEQLKNLALALSDAYFSGEELEHIKAHHGHEHEHR